MKSHFAVWRDLIAEFATLLALRDHNKLSAPASHCVPSIWCVEVSRFVGLPNFLQVYYIPLGLQCGMANTTDYRI